MIFSSGFDQRHALNLHEKVTHPGILYITEVTGEGPVSQETLGVSYTFHPVHRGLYWSRGEAVSLGMRTVELHERVQIKHLVLYLTYSKQYMLIIVPRVEIRT